MILCLWNLTFQLLLTVGNLLLKNCDAVGEIACEKCQEYSKYVYVDEASPVLSASYSELDSISKCGIVETPLIVGGQRVNEIEFPHMAAIGYKSNEENISFKCGGSLISELYILTAAHCELVHEYGPPVAVKLGIIYIHDSGPNAQLIDIESFISHPQYQSAEKYFDIALIKLKSFVKFDEYVRPACVCQLTSEWNKAIAVGFGKTQYENDKGSPHLMKVLLSYVDRATCVATYQSYKLLKNGIIDSQFCAGERKGNKDSCQGDSGGPLQIVMSEPYCMYNIIGITSFGKFCGFANSYGVYTNVTSFIDFIESIVWTE
ncbi:hypothetical protein PVAND_009357 [Polypedilum vanderplanki]|uniref:Peptidase S1 domain-containing protein n=1 Tax=Polypedilum vanderplanki TaxID=319348 RepID=A0A9J6CDH3_POLVA|nr:hypothetical protein PVAND_009357 [Polypedilum vanderplanki]